jgi:hypothetical protein
MIPAMKFPRQVFSLFFAVVVSLDMSGIPQPARAAQATAVALRQPNILFIPDQKIR